MAKEQFVLSASKGIVDLIDQAADQAGLSRGQTFEDFLTLLRCELAGKTMEEEYLSTVRKGYDKGKKGARGIDLLVQAGGRLIAEMANTGEDILGDVFTGAITYGEKGQYFTPEAICKLMAELTVGNTKSLDHRPLSANDPACGSGRFLLAVGRKHPHWELTGQDKDHRCVQMTAINMALHGLHGWAVWQNSLTLERFRAYKIGFFFNGAARGLIREVSFETSLSRSADPSTNPSTNSEPSDKKGGAGGKKEDVVDDGSVAKHRQLDLF